MTFGDDHTNINRAHWEIWAAAHGQDAYYDSAALISGTDSLTDLEWAGVAAAVGPVEGRDVLQVQCHLGFDAVSLSRHGARVTGVDFSPTALDKARELAKRCGAEVEYVEADVLDLPAALAGRFDLAYATMGILNWIGDLGAWMRSVASTLRPDGRLLLIDGHPLMRMVGSTDPLVLDFPYTFDGPHHLTYHGSYAAPCGSSKNVQFAYSLGEVVTAAVDAGLRVVRLTEHLDAPINIHGGDGLSDPDGRFRMRLGGQPVPLLYTLIAERTA